MRQGLNYLRLQLKRALRQLPGMLAVTLLLAVLAALAALVIAGLYAGDREARQPVAIGLVGDLEEGYLAKGLELLESVDSSRYSLRFLPMAEQEAARALRRGEISGYAVFPAGFAEALARGEHRSVTYVSAVGGSSLGAQLTRELAETVSALVLETENAVYGAQAFAAERLEGVDPYRTGDLLVVRYALRILDRSRLYELELLGESEALSLAGYFLCGLTVAFLLLWAISASPLYAGRSRELGRLLQARRCGAPVQVLAEYLAGALLMLCGLAAALAAVGLLLGRFGLQIPELEGGGLGRFGLGAVPAALMLCALQFFLYELTDSAVAGVLLQFLNAAVQGYLAGCFYPADFFPEGLRRLGAALPAGAAMDALGRQLRGEGGSPAVWLWLAALLGLAVLLRRRRNRA